MKISRLCLAALASFLPLGNGFCQTSQVKGRIVDGNSNTPLPFANVFIDRTTIGTAADADGFFLLKNVPSGSIELLFSYVGYKLGRVPLTVTPGENNIGSVALTASEQQLSEVEIKVSRDKVWEKKLKRFEKIFLGDDEMAAQCKILNPWVLDFPDVKGKQLTAQTDIPIEIENNALGYKVYYFLSAFWKEPQAYLIDGKARFEQMPYVDEATTNKWLLNRSKAYMGSVRHLFKAIIDDRLSEEKFHLYTEFQGNENATARSQFFLQELGLNVMEYDTAVRVKKNIFPGVHSIGMKGRIEVHNYNESAIPRVYRDMGYRVSWVILENDKVLVNDEGNPIDPTKVFVSGDMSDQRVSYMLPLDYQEGEVTVKEPELPSLLRFGEKVYVATDKPYYYPGEPLWFSAFLNYRDPILMDSLSKVMHVEIINPDREIIGSKNLLINEGNGYGDFILPDTIKSGTYYLRAYTTWSRNFDDGMFVKPFAVLDITDKVDPLQAAKPDLESDLITIVSDRDTYANREKITLNLLTANPEGDPVPSKLSISVTDMQQVIPIKDSRNITTDFGVSTQMEMNNNELLPIEYGVSVDGKFLNDQGNPERTILNVMQLNPYSFFMAEADESGSFSITGLQVYDSVDLYFKSEKAKSQKYGKVIISRRHVPIGSEIGEKINLPSEVTEFPQRIISEYEVPKDARMLEGVEVRDTKIDEESFQRYAESYGQPDYVLDGSKLNKSYGNLLLVLNGQFPGLVVRETNDPQLGSKWVIYTERARNTSIRNAPEMMVMINNVTAVGDPVTVLAAIDPNTVSRIELTTRINSVHGARGLGGVLSIYTKTGDDIADRPIDPNFITARVKGYDRPRDFKAPAYDNPPVTQSTDYRSTLYWNPLVITDEKGKGSVSFFAADLETTYRVVVEGITNDQRPFRGEYYLKVNDSN